MKKFLVLLLCLFTATGLMTTASISAQRNAWKREAEQAGKERDQIQEKYDAYQQEMKEKMAALTTERDAYALLTQAMEEENNRLNQELSQARDALSQTAAQMEAQVNQANADKAWAEQRLQEALDILLTPAPSPAPTASPLPTETQVEESPQPESSEHTENGGLTDSIWGRVSFTLPTTSPEAPFAPSPSPAPTVIPAETEAVPEAEFTVPELIP